MNHMCLSDSSTEESSEKRELDEYLPCNKIFLNFTREFKNPAKDRFNIAKVKELFKAISERQDLQEMQVSGWLEKEEATKDEECENEEELEEKLKRGLDSDYDDECQSTPKGGGHRFAMSRDFWYRKLNTLKAQKLDEAALEAQDIPPDGPQQPKCIKYIQSAKVFASQIQENSEDVNKQISYFNERIAKPVEKVLKSKFINVYDHQNTQKNNYD